MFEETMMRKMSLVCVVTGLMVSGVAMGQMQMPAAPASPAGPTGPAAEVQRSYAAAKANILKSADKMPAADYQYKPTPDVRTYARVLNHVTEAQANSCGAANGTAADARVKAPAETADKATVVAALNASFAECDKAFAALTDANALEMVDLGRGKRSRIGLMWGTSQHDTEQYATLALYLRLKGIAPPSSEK
jgi:DinB superfamily